jgi:hypothetical protein
MRWTAQKSQRFQVLRHDEAHSALTDAERAELDALVADLDADEAEALRPAFDRMDAEAAAKTNEKASLDAKAAELARIAEEEESLLWRKQYRRMKGHELAQSPIPGATTAESPRMAAWQAERAAFERLAPGLEARYRGRYVAVYGGRVVQRRVVDRHRDAQVRSVVGDDSEQRFGAEDHGAAARRRCSGCVPASMAASSARRSSP